MTDGSEKRKHQLTFELQRSRVFKNPTPMRSPLSQKVTWPAATRENPGNEIIEESNFSDVCVLQPQNKRSRYEMRNGYEACQISLLYVCLFDGALQRSRVFKNPTPMRSPLSQKVTWPAATRENPGNEIIEESNFSDIPVVQPQKERSRFEIDEKWLWSLSDLFVLCFS